MHSGRFPLPMVSIAFGLSRVNSARMAHEVAYRFISHGPWSSTLEKAKGNVLARKHYSDLVLL